MRFEDDTLYIDRELSTLDEMVLDFVSVLDEEDVEYVIVAGYVAILTGRSRATEDVDIVVERLSREETESLAERLDEEGYWGATIPLDDLHEMLEEGLRVRIAEAGQMAPNFEMWFVKNEYERDGLSDPLVVAIGDRELRVSPLELQIAYKLFLGARTDTEDALHLYEVFQEHLDIDALERYVSELDVKAEYDELRGA